MCLINDTCGDWPSTLQICVLPTAFSVSELGPLSLIFPDPSSACKEEKGILGDCVQPVVHMLIYLHSLAHKYLGHQEASALPPLPSNVEAHSHKSGQNVFTSKDQPGVSMGRQQMLTWKTESKQQRCPSSPSRPPPPSLHPTWWLLQVEQLKAISPLGTCWASPWGGSRCRWPPRCSRRR